MMQRMNGMKCPRDTGGLMRRGVVLLAALLLVCTLMAGAVSAEAITISDGNITNLTKHLASGDTVTLGADIGSSVAPILYNTSDNQTVITGKAATLNLATYTIYAQLTDTGGKNTIPFIKIGNESETENGSLTVTANGGQIIVSNKSNWPGLFGVYNSSTLSITGGTYNNTRGFVVSGNGYLKYAGVNISIQNANLNSPVDTVIYMPSNGSLTITGSTLKGAGGGVTVGAGKVIIENTQIEVAADTLNPRQPPEDGSIDDGSALALQKKNVNNSGTGTGYKGSIEIELKGTTSLKSQYYAISNYVNASNLRTNEIVSVKMDTGVSITGTQGNIRAAWYDKDTGTDMKVGTFVDGSSSTLLIPGINFLEQNNGIVWTKTDDNYTLTISKSGSYKLMDAFSTTGTGIKITADGVTLDGDGKQITGTGTMTGYILKVDTSSSTGTTGVTLDKLNITTGNDVSNLTGKHGFLTLYNKTILKNSKLNFSGFTTTNTDTMVPGVYIVFQTANGTQLTGNTIWGGNLGSGDSQARVVVIDNASDVLVKDNTLHMGTAIVSETLKESYGVQIKAKGTKNATVINNTIIAGETNKADYKGIDIITVGDYGNHTITGNTFNLHKVENNSVIQITAGSGTPTEGFLNITVTGNKFASSSGAGYGIYAKVNPTAGLKNLTLLGIIKNNDFNKAENLLKNILGTNTHINLTNNADWGAAAKTIEVTGNTSIENVSTNKETLTAKFTDGSSAAFNWAITGTPDIIEFEGPASGSSVTYKPLNIGTTNLTVSSGGVSKVVIITVYNTTAPSVDTKVTTEADGKVNLSVSTGGESTITATTDANGKATSAVITDPSSKTTIVLTYTEPATVTEGTAGSVTSVSGTIDKMVAAYPKSEAPVSADMPVPAKYALNITLNASKALQDGANIILPIIDPAIKQEVVTKITSKNNNHKPLAMITASAPSETTIEQINSNISNNGIELKIIIPKEGKPTLGKVKALHISGNTITEDTFRVQQTLTEWVITIYGNTFSTHALVEDTTPTPPASSGGSGNMDGALRVLFNDGSATLSVVTGLSYGDKLTAPANPVKDGYTFGGWYKDEACTQAWSFSDGIPGDMTLYAKWTGGSSSSQSSSQQSGTTTQPTAKATTAPASTQSQSGTSATSAPVSTTAASGVSPTMTQAPAPVLGALLGLLAAGVFLRRRE